MMEDVTETQEEAAHLDRLLAQVVAPAVPPGLERRILADFDTVQARWSFSKAVRRAADAVWPGAPVWQPAAAFALALFVGFGAAAFAPVDVAPDDSAFTLDQAPDAGQDL